MSSPDRLHTGFSDCKGICLNYGTKHLGCPMGRHFEEGKDELDNLTIGLEERLETLSPSVRVNDQQWVEEYL